MCPLFEITMSELMELSSALSAIAVIRFCRGTAVWAVIAALPEFRCEPISIFFMQGIGFTAGIYDIIGGVSVFPRGIFEVINGIHQGDRGPNQAKKHHNKMDLACHNRPANPEYDHKDSYNTTHHRRSPSGFDAFHRLPPFPSFLPTLYQNRCLIAIVFSEKGSRTVGTRPANSFNPFFLQQRKYAVPPAPEHGASVRHRSLQAPFLPLPGRMQSLLRNKPSPGVPP